MVFFSTGCVKRRSTSTTIVLSFLSLTTVPCRTRFGIILLALRLLLRRGLGLRRGLRLLRVLRRDRGQPRDVATNLAHPRRVLELAARPLEAQVELLLLQAIDLLDLLVAGHQSNVCGLHRLLPLVSNALNETRTDRQLGGTEAKCLLGKRRRHAIDLEHDATRLHPARPELRRALALA